MRSIHEVLRESHVLDLGPLPAPRLTPGATVHQGLQLLARARRGAIVLVEGTRPVGIFTERDVVYRLPGGLFAAAQGRARTPLREVMSQPPVTIRRQATLLEAIRTMDAKLHRHLVVVDRNGDLRGLLTSSDLVQFLTDHFPQDTMNLPPRLTQRYANPEGG